MNKHQIQLHPKAGQILWYVDLSEIRSHSVSEALELLEQMGYQPQLRYLETQNGLKLFALLKDEQRDPNQVIDDEYLIDERLALFEAFPGDDMAIHLTNGVPVKTAIAS
ncbi:hypothetical protein LEP3755_07400 [Leptolyngbya sp. NIES-3755]|nr:hypothetical protein LEP3755_07400 [Leptolyngbya sp. NIES-3755]